MKIEGYPQKKNTLIRRLADFTGERAVYNGAPDFSYDIGPYRVFRDGGLGILEEDADPEIIRQLVMEDLLKDKTLPGIRKGGVIDAERIMQEEAQAAVGSRAGKTLPENPIRKENSAIEQNREAPLVETTVRDRSRIVYYDKPIVIRDRVVTIQTMVNLLYMIHSKQELLNHALQRRRAFWVDEQVLAEITYRRPQTLTELNRITGIPEKKGFVKGISFTTREVIFTGFPEANDFIVRMAYEKLAEEMYKHASSVKRVSWRKVDTCNEKYNFRSWLNHMNFAGRENKAFRTVFLKNLDGFASYHSSSQRLAARTRKSGRSYFAEPVEAEEKMGIESTMENDGEETTLATTAV